MMKIDTAGYSMVAIIGLFVVLAACKGPSKTAASLDSSVSWHNCRYEVPGEKLRCGVLDVPEDRGQPDSARVLVPFAIIKSHADESKPDPVVFLSGGPGGSAIGELAIVAMNREWLSERDVIVVEARGNGESKPSLACDSENLERCAENLINAGVNLNMYGTDAAAADVADLRRALNIEEWNVYGVSYGTRWAMVLMRDHPNGIRSVIMDSVSPVMRDIFEADVESVLDGLSEVFRACAESRTCRTNYPDLRQQFWRIVEKLDQEPIPLPEETWFGEQLDGLAFAILLAFSIKGEPHLVANVPAAIMAVEAGNLELAISLLKPTELPGLTGFPEDLESAIGVELSVNCRESAPFSRLEQLSRGALELRTDDEWPSEFTRRIVMPGFALCRSGVWPITAADDRILEPPHSEIPTLLISGQFDTITRPRFAREVAETLSNAYIVDVPNAAHAVLEDSECARKISVQFMNDPSTGPDTTCLPSDFDPEWR